MIVVIQCAASKRPTAGYMTSTNGARINFVAHPECAPAMRDRGYARPDDTTVNGKSWRELLLDYNREGRRDLGLLPAYRLYTAPIYSRLVERLGTQRVYILSAGWGLIRADFLTPYYDITFSAVKPGDTYKRRTGKDYFSDFRLPEHVDDDLMFFGGEVYRALFCALTNSVTGTRTVFSLSDSPIAAPGCTVRHFRTRRQTNWHYQCAESFLSGTL